MIKLLTKINRYRSFYYNGTPKLLPLNLTISVTSRCNSRCLTCNIWQADKVNELSVDEYRKIFASIGKVPAWLTMSGGEPFLRNDLAEIVKTAVEYMEPEIVNIPTNGLLTDRIISTVDKLCAAIPKTQLVINVSVDGIDKQDDEIRNVPNAYLKAKATFEGLKKLNHPNLTIGVHTVVSRFNVANIEEIMDHLLSWEPDSYITEVAENRVELQTLESDISPPPDAYLNVLKLLSEKISPGKFKGLSRLTQAIRREYYALLAKELREKKSIIPCYAAFSSAQINAAGEVWNCCVLALSMGNLKDFGYDFPKLWFSPQAQEIRETLKKNRCYCPLANAHYTSMLFHYPTLMRIGLRYIFGF